MNLHPFLLTFPDLRGIILLVDVAQNSPEAACMIKMQDLPPGVFFLSKMDFLPFLPPFYSTIYPRIFCCAIWLSALFTLITLSFINEFNIYFHLFTIRTTIYTTITMVKGITQLYAELSKRRKCKVFGDGMVFGFTQ